MALKRVTAILLEVTLVTQVLIVGVYWPVLHHLVLDKLKTESDAVFLYYHMIFIHSVPFLAILFNTMLSRTVLIPGHCLYVVLVGFIYCFFNYAGVRYRGHALYPFLPWEDYKSILVCIVLLVFGAILYQIVCFIIIKIKKRPIEYWYDP